MRVEGTNETREFYDQRGWETDATGTSVDRELFGTKEDGPIRRRIFARKWKRLNDFIDQGLTRDHVLEVGCGGWPEPEILKGFRAYTGLDFSERGLELAAKRADGLNANATFALGDAVDLPFENDVFDCVYSAHMIYHIRDAKAQEKALSEMCRVLKPGGALLIEAANPRPVLFPMRALIRIVAETPGLSTLARKAKGRSPVPYNPQKIGWMKSRLATLTQLDVLTGKIASTAFNQSVRETGLGKPLWQLFDRLEAAAPRLSARLGNYVLFLGRK